MVYSGECVVISSSRELIKQVKILLNQFNHEKRCSLGSEPLTSIQELRTHGYIKKRDGNCTVLNYLQFKKCCLIKIEFNKLFALAKHSKHCCCSLSLTAFLDVYKFICHD